MAEDNGKEQPVVEKKSRKRLLGVLVTSVLIASAGVTGTVLGPRLLGMEEQEEPDPEASASAQPEGEEEEEGVVPNAMAFQPVIVDVRDKQQQPHHMKVGLAVELADGVKKDEFERLSPRGREAAIAYLRSRVFEDLTDPAQFETTAKELGERIVKAMGPKYTKRIVITDFVVQ